MSRTGKKLINIPDKVKVVLQKDLILIEGPLGKTQLKLFPGIEVHNKENNLEVTRQNDTPQLRAFHGLVRSHLANKVKGVSEGFKKELDIQGVGYRAEVKGHTLSLSLGFSHPVEFPIPQSLKIQVDKQTHLVVFGSDKDEVGQIAADIRRLRPPEPYKGKGIRYTGEVILRKAGKTASSGKK